jgi:hypothetical protein
MRSLRFVFCAACFLLGLFSSNMYAQSYTVLVADIQGLDTLIQLVKTMGEDMNVTFDMQKVPFARMISMIQSKQANFGTPMLFLKDPNKIKQLPFDYSTAVIDRMCFILYTNKAKPIDVTNLKNGNSNKYQIESDIGNMQMFNFSTLASTNIPGSLKKVNDGKIDGYIMGVAPTDDILRANKDSMKNIKRQLWDIFDMGFIIQKGAKGGPDDKFLSAGMKKMVDSGKFLKIIGDLAPVEKYVDWQP